MEKEGELQRERKLLRSIGTALSIACVLVVGLTCAVVHLSKDTSVRADIFVSKDSNQPWSTDMTAVSYQQGWGLGRLWMTMHIGCDAVVSCIRTRVSILWYPWHRYHYHTRVRVRDVYPKMTTAQAVQYEPGMHSLVTLIQKKAVSMWWSDFKSTSLCMDMK